jgi:hypothetical protein
VLHVGQKNACSTFPTMGVDGQQEVFSSIVRC